MNTALTTRVRANTASLFAWMCLILLLAGVNVVSAADPAGPSAAKPKSVLQLEAAASTWPADARQIMCLDFSSDGRKLAVGHGYWNSPGLLRVWTLPEHRCVHQRSLPLGLSSIGFLGDSNSLAYTGWGALFATRDLQTGQSSPIMPFDRSVGRFALSKDKTRAVTATEGYAPRDDSGGRVVKIWNPRTGELVVECDSEDLCRLMCTAYSPTGKYVAAAGGVFQVNPVGRVYLWDAMTGKLERTIESPRAPIDVMAFSPDGKALATGANNGSVRLWDVEKGTEVRAWENKGNGVGIMALAFSPDGARLAAGTEIGRVTVWSTETGESVQTVENLGTRVLAMAYSPDGQTVAAGTESGRLVLWNAETGKPAWEAPAQSLRGLSNLVGLSKVIRLPDAVLVGAQSGQLHDMAWQDGAIRQTFKVDATPILQIAASSDAAHVGGLSIGGTVAVWERATGKEVLKLQTTGAERITAIALVGTPTRLVAGNAGGTIQLVDLSDQSVIKTAVAHRGSVHHLRTGTTGNWLATADDQSEVVKVWELPTLKSAQTLNVRAGTITALAWSPNEETLITAGLNQHLSQWDRESGEIRAQAEPTEPIVGLAVAPDGDSFVSTTASGTLSLWPMGGKSPRQIIPAARKISSIDWSADGRHLLATDSSDRLSTWQTTAAPSPLAILASAGGNRVTAAFSPNGRWFASGGDDRVVTVRAVATGEVVKELQGHRSVLYNCEFSADSRLLATAGLEGTVRIWDTENWRMLQAMPHQGSVRAVGFSMDAKWIATGTSERVASIWEVETGRKLLELPNQPAWVMGVVFDSDRRTLYTATGGWDPAYAAIGSTVASWKLEPTADGLKGTVLMKSQARAGSMECLRITKDGQLITSGTDSQIVIWDPKTLNPTGAMAHSAPFHRGTLLSGDRLFAAGDVSGRISVWDLKLKQRLRLFTGHAGHVFDVAASVDGEIVASASEDDTIQFWSATGRERPTPEWKPFIERVRDSESENKR